MMNVLRNMKNRFDYLFLYLVLVLIFVAFCGCSINEIEQPAEPITRTEQPTEPITRTEQPEEPKVITVSQDGTGDYSNLRIAVESITDADTPCIIEVYPGVYNVSDYFSSAEIQTGKCRGITLTDGMTLRGVGENDKIVLNGILDKDLYSLSERNYFSVLSVAGLAQ